MRDSKHTYLEKVTHRLWTDFYPTDKDIHSKTLYDEYGQPLKNIYNLDCTLAAFIVENLKLFQDYAIADLNKNKVDIHTKYALGMEKNPKEHAKTVEVTLGEAINIIKNGCIDYLNIESEEHMFDSDYEHKAMLEFDYSIHVLADTIRCLWN